MRSPIQERSELHRSLADIIEESRGAPPREPSEAAASFIYVLARELLRREARSHRKELVVRDFEEASRALVQAAGRGATWGEQAKILQDYWERFELSEPLIILQVPDVVLCA